MWLAVYTRTHTYTHIHVHTHTRVQTCMHPSVCTWYTCIHTCIHTYLQRAYNVYVCDVLWAYMHPYRWMLSREMILRLRWIQWPETWENPQRDEKCVAWLSGIFANNPLQPCTLMITFHPPKTSKNTIHSCHSQCGFLLDTAAGDPLEWQKSDIPFAGPRCLNTTRLSVDACSSCWKTRRERGRSDAMKIFSVTSTQGMLYHLDKTGLWSAGGFHYMFFPSDDNLKGLS